MDLIISGQGSALLLLQTSLWELISGGSALANAILAILVVFSIASWTIIFSKWSTLGAAKNANLRFARAFRKSGSMDAVVAVAEQFRPAPLVAVFDQGFDEVSRQVKTRGSLGNRDSIARTLQVATNQELAYLERNLSWLATTASVSPFIGLLGTVLGIIRAFQNLGAAGSTSLSSVGPGIAEALIATAAGLFAAIPAALAYNHFGHTLKEMGSQMDDFGLEFLNLIERSFGE
ncbi:MAG TPA: MotA/TolQ/ExbB proton channel family protein [Bryobacteraceae bacterium]|nr:MotA/TolQ/ExbB proton channel family protein [Bryobacteraceae bacterium]